MKSNLIESCYAKMVERESRLEDSRILEDSSSRASKTGPSYFGNKFVVFKRKTTQHYLQMWVGSELPPAPIVVHVGNLQTDAYILGRL